MKLVKASEFRANIAELLQEAANGEVIIIIQGGVPVAKVVDLSPEEQIAFLKQVRALYKTPGPKPKEGSS